MSYGTDDEPIGRLPPVFQRLGGSHSLSAPTAISEEPMHVYSEPPPPPPSNNGHLGIRIASRPTYMQPQHYTQSNPMYNPMSYAPSQVSTSPAVLHQERSYYSPSHSAPPMNMHDYSLPSSPSSLSMVPSSEKASIQFVRDIGAIKDPTLNRQVLSFLPGNKQSTPYHYSPYSEEKIQWGNKGNSSTNVIHPGGSSSSPHGSQLSSPSSSASSEAPYHKKDSRLDIAKSIKITSYKKPEDNEDLKEHHSVGRRVTLSSKDSHSYSSSDKNSSRNHEREHSREDRHTRSRQTSSGSIDQESSHIMRHNDFYVPDYNKRPLPPRAALTGRKRQRNRSVSPDRHRSNRNSSRSPIRQGSRSIANNTATTATSINDRLNISQVTAAVPTASTSSTSTGSNHSGDHSESSGASALYQNKTWIKPPEKLPLSKKFTPKDQLSPVKPTEKVVKQAQNNNVSPADTTVDTTQKSHNKIWVKSTDDNTTSSTTVSKSPQHREQRYKESSRPLPPSKKFSSVDAKTATPKPSANKPPSAPSAVNKKSIESTPAKPIENPKAITNVNKQKNVSSNSSDIITKATVAVQPSVQPKVTNAKTNATKTPSTVSTTTTVAHSVADPTVHSAASASTTSADIKTSSKELVSCSKAMHSVSPTNGTKLNTDCIIKEEPCTKEIKLSAYNKCENYDDMNIDEVMNHNGNKNMCLSQADATTIMGGDEDTLMVNQMKEKRLSDMSDVPELIQSKKRKVPSENDRNPFVNNANTEFITRNDDLMEVDSIQNQGESACSSSINSSTTTISDMNGAFTDIKIPTLSTSAPEVDHTKSAAPMVIDAATHSSSNPLHVQVVSNEVAMPSNNSTTSTMMEHIVYEKENILDQIFEDGYSRDVTPEVSVRSTRTTVGKSTLMNERNRDEGSNVTKAQEQNGTAPDMDKNNTTTASHQVDIPKKMTSPPSDKIPIAASSTVTEMTTPSSMGAVGRTKDEKKDADTTENMTTSQQQITANPTTDNKPPSSPQKSHDSTPQKKAAAAAAARKKSRVLPKPWIMLMSDTGEMFYVNTETKESTTVRPVL